MFSWTIDHPLYSLVNPQPGGVNLNSAAQAALNHINSNSQRASWFGRMINLLLESGMTTENQCLIKGLSLSNCNNYYLTNIDWLYFTFSYCLTIAITVVELICISWAIYPYDRPSARQYNYCSIFICQKRQKSLGKTNHNFLLPGNCCLF